MRTATSCEEEEGILRENDPITGAANSEVRKEQPLNLTCFALVAMFVCFCTWGFDHKIFKIEDYKNLREVYTSLGIGLNMLSSKNSPFVFGSRRFRILVKGGTVLASLLIGCIWGIVIFMYITRPSTEEAFSSKRRKFTIKAHASDADLHNR